MRSLSKRPASQAGQEAAGVCSHDRDSGEPEHTAHCKIAPDTDFKGRHHKETIIKSLIKSFHNAHTITHNNTAQYPSLDILCQLELIFKETIACGKEHSKNIHL